MASDPHRYRCRRSRAADSPPGKGKALEGGDRDFSLTPKTGMVGTWKRMEKEEIQIHVYCILIRTRLNWIMDQMRLLDVITIVFLVKTVNMVDGGIL